MINIGNRSALLGFALVLITLVVNGILTYQNLRRLRKNEDIVRHTDEVLLQLKTVQVALSDAETGQRGYIITADKSYLVPYDDARSTLDQSLAKLKTLTRDNPSQLLRLDELEKEINTRLKVLMSNLAARERSFDEAKDRILTGQGKKSMDTIRKILASMQEEELSLLQLRTAESDASYGTAMVTGLLASVLGVAMAVIGYSLVVRDVRRRDKMAQVLRESNDYLEQRVQDRTADLERSNQSLNDEVAVRREAEDQAHKFADELQRSNRELEQFASVASHDLQEPLRKIQAFGDRLRTHCEPQLGEKGKDYLERMLSSSKRMRRLIDDLLAFSRIATKSQPFARVDLNRIAQEVLGDLESRIEQTGGRVDLQPLPVLQADPVQMRQLLQNLIGNALKFQKPNEPPVVQVSATQLRSAPSGEEYDPQASYCEIIVQDNGIGFEQTYTDRIFELFQRLHGRDEYEGTGMGLAICRKIAERHGGSIAATSSPGQGARFVVTLPLTQGK